MIAAITLAGTALALAPAPLALAVAPAHAALAAGGNATIHVRSARQMLLTTAVAGLELDARGRPRVVGSRDAGAWLVVRPRTLSVGPRGASFVIASRRPAHARPGDHTAIVLLTAAGPAGHGVATAIRVGLVVTVRVPGHTVRRLEVIAARSLPGSRSRTLFVIVANRGDVIEAIGGAALQITLVRRGRVLERFKCIRRKLLPRTRAVVTFRVPSRIRGNVVARVAVMTSGGKAAVRRFPLRL